MNELRFGLILTDLCRTASFCSNMGSVGEISTANKIPILTVLVGQQRRCNFGEINFFLSEEFHSTTI